MHPISLLKAKVLSIFILLFVSFSAFSQAPNLLNYQGVARNSVGNPLPNQTMKLRLSIHDLLPSGAVVYSEIRQITTNLGGLFSVQIGSAGASSSTGTIAGVNWIVGNKFLQVELDPASNNNYLDIGTAQLVSVPYAFGAGTAATVKTNANLTGVVTSVGNATAIANGAITSDMIGTLNKSKVGLDLVNNTSDAAKPISTLAQAALDLKASAADVTTAMGSKLNIADSTRAYVTPSQLASKTFDQTPITNAIAGKLAIADSTNGYVTPTQLAAKTFDTTSLSNRINSKASAASLALVTANVASNTSSITSNTASIASNTADLALKSNIASPTFTGTVTTGIINTGALSSTSVTAPIYASAPKTLSYTGTTINWNPAQGLNAAITLTQNSTLSFTAAPPVGSYGTIVLTQDGTGSRAITLPTIGNVTNKVLGSTSTSTVALSTTANSKDILNFYYDGTNCYWNIGQGYGDAASGSSSGNTNLASAVTGTLAIANGGTGATTAAAALTNLGAAPLASPTFTGTVTTGIINTGVLSATSVNTPIYASTPQALTDGSTITWNPALGLNASVTLGGNRTLSFTTTPPAGAYGTLVVTQDVTGNRTITLPTTANKVLGSTSTTTIALSTAANAKDILNFYYDGTNCFWNIGQGYGTVASSSTTTNITLTTTGTGSATLSGTTLNIPSPSTISIGAIGTSNVNGATISGTTLSLTPADGINGGIVTTGVQTFTGAKTFSNTVTFNSDITLNSITVGRGGGNNGSNTSLGINGLYRNTTGFNNTTLGAYALELNTSGSYNTVIGTRALSYNTIGSFNTAIGTNSLGYNTGEQNTAVGQGSLERNTSGNYNTGIGRVALFANTTGINNTALGLTALSVNETGSNNTAIGAEANVASVGLNNTTAIGYQASVSTDNTIQLGNSSVTSVNTSGTITAAALGLGVSSPNASALLEVSSSTKGFLPPRMTSTQKLAITSPALGLIIYCTDCGANGEPEYYNGSAWLNFNGSSAAAGPLVIGTQKWMEKNLDVSTYRNGDIIPQVTDATAWENLTTGAWCYYNNDPLNGAIYGKLYNWYAVNDPRGLAPQGFHIPTNGEWSTLGAFLGGDVQAGGKMYSSTQFGSMNSGATNQSGYSAVSGGDRYLNGLFGNAGGESRIWSASETNSSNAYNVWLQGWNNRLHRQDMDKRNGFSVRCLRD